MANETRKPTDRTQAEIDAARARARAYQEQQVQGEDAPTPAAAPAKGPRSESEWNDVVSQAIEDAMRKGEFDNLRGHGKPLPRKDNTFTPAGSELAYDILQNNDMTPGWIGDRKAIQQEIERWRAALRADVLRLTAEWAGAHTAATQEALRERWQGRRSAHRDTMDALNRRIRDVNLQQPVSTLHLFMLRLPEEERRAGLPEPLLPPA